MMTLNQFKAAIRKGEAPPQCRLLKAATLKVEAAGERRKLFTISTATVDRDNDTVAADGWDLAAYMKNPVVLWGHDSYMPPIGRSTQIGTEGGALKAEVEFVPADMPLVGEQAEMVWRMCDQGFLSACSVGFRPLEFHVAKDRMDEDDWWPPVDFVKQELMEWSICSIPANPEAVIDPTERRNFQAAAAAEAAAAATAEAAKAARRRLLRAACV